MDELSYVHHTSLEENEVAVVLLGVSDPLLLRTMHNYIPRRSFIEALGRHLPFYEPFSPGQTNRNGGTVAEWILLLLGDLSWRGIIRQDYYIEERGNITKLSGCPNSSGKVQSLGLARFCAILEMLHRFISHTEFEKQPGKE